MLFETKTKAISAHKNSLSHFPLHSHHHIEIVICTEGTLSMSCNTVEQTLTPGDVMIAFSNDIHAFIEGNSKNIVIIFNPDISEQMTLVLQKTQYHNFVSCPEVISVASALCDNYENENPLVAYGMIHTIMGMILKEACPSERQMDFSAFDVAIRYVSRHYTEKLTLVELAKAVGVSGSHLSRMFSERISGGFQHYLQILRVEKAKSLLLGTNLSISEIMYASGFSDQRTFNRVFKKILSVTPREYRNAQKNGRSYEARS